MPIIVWVWQYNSVLVIPYCTRADRACLHEGCRVVSEEKFLWTAWLGRSWQKRRVCEYMSSNWKISHIWQMQQYCLEPTVAYYSYHQVKKWYVCYVLKIWGRVCLPPPIIPRGKQVFITRFTVQYSKHGYGYGYGYGQQMPAICTTEQPVLT